MSTSTNAPGTTDSFGALVYFLNPRECIVTLLGHAFFAANATEKE